MFIIENLEIKNIYKKENESHTLSFHLETTTLNMYTSTHVLYKNGILLDM